MREEITFKTVDDIIEYYRWGSYARKGSVSGCEDGSECIPGTGEDSQEKRKSPDGEDVL